MVDRAVGALGDRGDGQRLAHVGAVVVVGEHVDRVGPLSSATVAVSSFATGSSLTFVTVTVTVAVSVPPLPSLIV